MIESFKFEKGYWYPHMKPRDIAIWERFIAANPEAYDTCQYDFHVGDSPTFDTTMDDGSNKNQHMLYQLKIDAIGNKGGKLDIIEVKPAAGPSTIGQVQGYRHLYIRDEKASGNIGIVIVTDEEKLNMRFLCEAAGVKLIVV